MYDANTFLLSAASHLRFDALLSSPHSPAGGRSGRSAGRDQPGSWRQLGDAWEAGAEQLRHGVTANQQEDFAAATAWFEEAHRRKPRISTLLSIANMRLKLGDGPLAAYLYSVCMACASACACACGCACVSVYSLCEGVYMCLLVFCLCTLAYVPMCVYISA